MFKVSQFNHNKPYFPSTSSSFSSYFTLIVSLPKRIRRILLNSCEHFHFVSRCNYCFNSRAFCRTCRRNNLPDGVIGSELTKCTPPRSL